MTNVIADVYRVLLDTETPSTQIQQRILRYAERAKDYELLGRLAGHASLDPAVDAQLRNHDAATVKAAWAARPGRTSDELIALIEGETRVKVLAALAERDDLPTDVYATIARQAKGQGALLAVVVNQIVDSKVRISAASRYIDVIREAAAKNEDTRRGRTQCADGLSKLFSSAPDIAADIVRGTQDLDILATAAYAARLEPDEQRAYVKATLAECERLEKEIDTTSPRWHHDGPQNLATRTADSLSQNGAVDPEAASPLLVALQGYLSEMGEDQWRRRSLDTSIAELQNAAAMQPDNLAQRVSDATTTEQVEVILNEIVTDLRYSSDNRRQLLLLSLIANPATSVAQVTRAVEWLGWRAQQALKNVTDPAKAAAILVHAHWIEHDRVLNNTGDPHQVLKNVITLALTNDLSIPGWVLESRYLTADIAAMLPLEYLTRENAPAMVKGHMLGIIEDGLADDESWSVFETLAIGFNGSVSDLVQTSRSV